MPRCPRCVATYSLVRPRGRAHRHPSRSSSEIRSASSVRDRAPHRGVGPVPSLLVEHEPIAGEVDARRAERAERPAHERREVARGPPGPSNVCGSPESLHITLGSAASASIPRAHSSHAARARAPSPVIAAARPGGDRGDVRVAEVLEVEGRVRRRRRELRREPELPRHHEQLEGQPNRRLAERARGRDEIAVGEERVVGLPQRLPHADDARGRNAQRLDVRAAASAPSPRRAPRRSRARARRTRPRRARRSAGERPRTTPPPRAATRASRPTARAA